MFESGSVYVNDVSTLKRRQLVERSEGGRLDVMEAEETVWCWMASTERNSCIL